jgi:hypothetical protein
MKGNLFVGSLKFGIPGPHQLSGGRVAREHKLIAQQGELRSAMSGRGRTGCSMCKTDSRSGKMLRVLPPR